MGFFGKILEKLGLADGKEVPAPPVLTPKPVAPSTSQVAVLIEPPPVLAIPVVDVVARLEKRAAANTQKLSWRTSIVDLPKLLEIDSSLAARKELAAELGCPADLMADSARMNTWLHRAVLTRIAANGGSVPPDLLD